MSQYMLLLYDNPVNWAAISPEEMQKALQKYMAWNQKPFMVTSKRLGPDAGRIVKSVLAVRAAGIGGAADFAAPSKIVQS